MKNLINEIPTKAHIELSSYIQTRIKRCIKFKNFDIYIYIYLHFGILISYFLFLYISHNLFE